MLPVCTFSDSNHSVQYAGDILFAGKMPGDFKISHL